MRLAIIGHGPSLSRRELGYAINTHDEVMRLKRSWDLAESGIPYFGSKTTCAMGSLNVMAQFVAGWHERNVKHLYGFIDTRTWDAPPEAYPDLIVYPELCKEWVEKYRSMRSKMILEDQQEAKGHLSDEYGHLHFSAGMFAILYAMAKIQPDHLSLFGFDSLLTGHFLWSITRGTAYNEYPDHNWETESRLLKVIADEYGYEMTQPEIFKRRVAHAA